MSTHVAEMIRVARGGSEECLGKLLHRYRNYLKLLAATRMSKLVRGRAGSSDVVQETSLQAFRSFEQFRGSTEGELLAWLRAVLASRLNRLLEQHVGAERRDVRREISLDQIARSLDNSTVRLEEILPDRDQSPSSHAHKHEQVLVVTDLLSELPEHYREVIVLRHLEGLKFPEVAERMQRSHGATRMLWFRAIESLRTKLSQRGLV